MTETRTCPICGRDMSKAHPDDARCPDRSACRRVAVANSILPAPADPPTLAEAARECPRCAEGGAYPIKHPDCGYLALCQPCRTLLSLPDLTSQQAMERIIDCYLDRNGADLALVNIARAALAADRERREAVAELVTQAATVSKAIKTTNSRRRIDMACDVLDAALARLREVGS